MWGKENGHKVGGRYHCIMVRSLDFILGATTGALRKDGEGYSIDIGKASTLHCRRAKIIITIIMMESLRTHRTLSTMHAYNSALLLVCMIS